MADRSKDLHQAATSAGDKQRLNCRFLPSSTLPRNLPAQPVAIADMADMFGVTHRTLHFYEEKRLISAGRMGLMRVYDPDDVRRMAFINICREIGMPVAVIQELMEELDMAESQREADHIFEDALMARRRELTAALSTIQRQTEQIERLLSATDGQNDQPHRSPRSVIDLTDLERRCLQLMAEGYAPLRLSRALELRSEEIADLEDAIIHKFEANNRFQAVAKAVLLGLVAS